MIEIGVLVKVLLTVTWKQVAAHYCQWNLGGHITALVGLKAIEVKPLFGNCAFWIDLFHSHFESIEFFLGPRGSAPDQGWPSWWLWFLGGSRCRVLTLRLFLCSGHGYCQRIQLESDVPSSVNFTVFFSVLWLFWRLQGMIVLLKAPVEVMSCNMVGKGPCLSMSTIELWYRLVVLR